MNKWLACQAALVAMLLSCQHEAEAPRPTGEVGLFYGDQIQERKEVTLTNQTQTQFGFKVALPKPKSGESGASVAAHVTRPGPAGRRVTEHLKFSLSPNERSLVHHLQVPPGSSGIWNIRVLVGEEVVIDRAMRVRSDAKN